MIVDNIRELLPLYALGILDGEDARTVERAIEADPELATELASFQQAALELVVAVPPPAHVKSRLLGSIGGGRFERFSARMGSLFDVSVDRAREILALIEHPASWELPVPGVALVHFAGGPASATADCGLVRLAPGTTFPPHTHCGEETSLVLAGRLRDGSRLFAPGDELIQGPGATNHVVVADGDEECIYAARAAGGIEINGARAKL